MASVPHSSQVLEQPKVIRTNCYFIQLTLFNPLGTVVKMFVVMYDLSDMPPNSQTFLRQRTLYMPSDKSDSHEDAQKWLRYLIHLRY